MNIDSLLPVMSGVDGLQPAASTTQAPFSNQLMAELSSTNEKLITAESALQDLAAGKTNNIHHVMLALEDAKLSFQLLVQVRNKVLEGYQDILRMQV